MSMSSAAAVTAASMSTFSGMHTEEDWSSEEARRYAEQEAEETGKEVDVIVQELPIVLSQQLAQTLILKQEPLRPNHRPYGSEGHLSGMRVKPVQKKLEMDFEIEHAGVNYQHDGSRLGDDPTAGHNYDPDHQYNVKKITLQAKPVPPKTNYCAGVLSNGVLYLTPINAVCRFKPSLGYIDAADQQAFLDSEAKREAHRAERQREGRMTEEEELEMEEEQYQKVKEEEGKKELQTVIMKVKKKDFGAANAAAGGGAAGGAAAAGGMNIFSKRQSYATLKQLEEREEWIPLKVYDPEAPISCAQFSKLLTPTEPAPPKINFNVAAQHYLSYVNPPDILEANSSNMALIATGDPLYLSFEERILYFMRNCRAVSLRDLCVKLQIVNEEQLELAKRELQNICWVIQGCLVLKSSIVYDRNWKPGMTVQSALATPISASSIASRTKGGLADRVQLSREYLLTQFHSNRCVYRDEINAVTQLELEPLDELLEELATKTKMETPETQRLGIPKGGQWEWKLPSDPSIRQLFPQLVLPTDKELPIIEVELRKALQTTSTHPIRESATRNLLLTHSENIVHQLVPAGLTANRTVPPTINELTQPRTATSSTAHIPTFTSGVASTTSASMLPMTGAPAATMPPRRR